MTVYFPSIFCFKIIKINKPFGFDLATVKSYHDFLVLRRRRCVKL